MGKTTILKKLQAAWALFDYDKVRGLDLRPAEEYFLAAIETVRANRRCFGEAVTRAPTRRCFRDSARLMNRTPIAPTSAPMSISKRI